MHMVKTIMFHSWRGGGGGHIQMAMLAAIGDWLGGSDWTTAGVTTEGRALLFLKFQLDPNFYMNVESLGKMISLMFALDHFRYARWMIIHNKGFLGLQLTCPTIYAEFQKGNFVTQKTRHKFSSLASDQVHERLNAIIKGDGVIIGITESESPLNRWTVGGPELAIDY